MTVITIRGQLGSGAPDIGKILAGRLRFDYVDREIIAAVAKKIDYSEDFIARKEMPGGTFVDRIIEALNVAYPAGVVREGAWVAGWELPLEDRKYLESLTAVIHELAKAGSIIIRARGSQFILKDRPDTRHILTVAPLQVRIKRVMDELKLDEQTAKKEITRFDSSRREFIKRYFNSEIEDPTNYDLVLNTEKLTFEDAASITEQVLPLREVVRNG